MHYEELNDDRLVEMGKSGDSDAIDCLIQRYRQMILAIARSYFLAGGDTEDLIQEGMLGVFRAIITYKSGKSTFKSYAYVCIKTAILSLIKKSTRDKNKPLNGYISLSGYLDNDADKSEIAGAEIFDPEREYINKEAELELKLKINNLLSKYENKILGLYLQGYSYDEIAKKTNKETKSIDNALQRIRKKISSKSH